jgi:hypothetical protein
MIEKKEPELLPQHISLHTVSVLIDFFDIKPDDSETILGEIVIMAPITLMLAYQSASDFESQERIFEAHLCARNIVKDFLKEVDFEGESSIKNTIEYLRSIWADSRIRWYIFYIDGDQNLKKYVENLLVKIRNAEAQSPQ